MARFNPNGWQPPEVAENYAFLGETPVVVETYPLWLYPLTIAETYLRWVGFPLAKIAGIRWRIFETLACHLLLSIGPFSRHRCAFYGQPRFLGMRFARTRARSIVVSEGVTRARARGDYSRESVKIIRTDSLLDSWVTDTMVT